MKNSWWWTEELPKHVDLHSKNKFEKLVRPVGFILRKKHSHSLLYIACIVQHHHYYHRLYSPGWALASSSKCRQWPLSWASARQFLRTSFLASSSTPSIHLDFARPSPRWLPRFVHNIFLGNSLSSIRTGPGSSVGIETELRAGWFGDRIPVGWDFPPFQTGPGPTQPPVQWVPGLSWG